MMNTNNEPKDVTAPTLPEQLSFLVLMVVHLVLLELSPFHIPILMLNLFRQSLVLFQLAIPSFAHLFHAVIQRCIAIAVFLEEKVFLVIQFPHTIKIMGASVSIIPSLWNGTATTLSVTA
jgi:hypothetical protein